MTDYDIVLQLCAPPTVNRDRLEEHMYGVLGVVEDHADEIALGPVVAVDFEDRLIDLAFTVQASSLEQAQQRVLDVIGIVEAKADLGFTPTATSSARVREGSEEYFCVA